MHEAPACVTVTVSPATEKVPVRLALEAFAAMVTATVPLPLPLAPLVTPSHDVVVAAVQVQPEPVVTLIEPGPPADGALAVSGDTA